MNDVVLRDLDFDESSEKRLTLRLSKEARETLKWIADQRSVSYAEVVRRALGTEKFLVDVFNRKGRVIVEIPGEKTKELVLI